MLIPAIAGFLFLWLLFFRPKQAHAATVSSQPFMDEELLQRLPVALVAVDIQTMQMVAANNAFIRMLGSASSLPFALPAPASHFFDSPGMEQALQEQAASQKKGLPRESELFLLRRSGDVSIPVSVSLEQTKGSVSLLSIQDDAAATDPTTLIFGQAVRKALPGLLYFVDASGRFLAGNLAFERLAGRSSSSLRGKLLTEILPRDIAEKFMGDESIRTSRTKQTTISTLVLPHTPDNRIELIRSPIFGPQGQYMGFLGLGHDVETRLKAEEKATQQGDMLAASNRSADYLLADEAPFPTRLQKALAALGIATGSDRVYVWRNQIENGKLYAAQIAEWVHGAPPLESLDIAPVISLDDEAPHWKTQLSSGTCINSLVRDLPEAEQLILMPQGIISVLVAPIMLRGIFWGFIGFDDCSRERLWSEAEESILRATGTLIASALHQMQATEALALSENRFRDVATATGEVIWEMNENNIITYISERCRELMGMAPEEIIGLPTLKVAPNQAALQEFRQEVREQVEKVGFFRGVEHTVLDAHNKLRIARSSGVPLYDEQGTYKGLRVTSLDITSEKANEALLKDALAQVRHANEELEHYAVITQELATEASSASRTKSEFLANIGHEVRTPINIITGMAYLALRTDLTGKQQDYLNKIHEAGESLLGILNSIISFAEMEGKSPTLGTYPFRFHDVVKITVSAFEEEAAGKGLALETIVSPDIPVLLQGDASRLGQVFKNLVHNAIKFTASGKITLRCEVESRKKASVVLRCQVKDTGIGIPAEQLDRIFTPFTQADGSSTRRFGGTGVGLALTKKLLEAMHGNIWVESSPGQGTSMFFTVELALGNASVAAESGEYAALRTTQRAAVRGRSVLIFTDNVLNGGMLGDVARSMGLVATLSTSRKEALMLMEAASGSPPFDLVIINLLADNRAKGRDLAKHIRSFPQYNTMPILAHGECNMADNKCFCLDLGIDECLLDIVSMDELQDILSRWICQGRTQLKHASAAEKKAGSIAADINAPLLFHCKKQVPPSSGKETKETSTDPAPDSSGNDGTNFSASLLLRKREIPRQRAGQKTGEQTDAAPVPLSQEVLADIAAFEALLQEDDASSLGVFEKLLPLLMRNSPDAAKGIQYALSLFDFGEALDLLRTYKKEQGMN